jgi:hypothetical protein
MASNRRWRFGFRCRGSRRRSAVAQLSTLGIAHTLMKTFATIIILGAVFFVKSTLLAADAIRVSPSPIELVMDCGNVYSNRLSPYSFDSSVEFREATEISIAVTFRSIGEFFVFEETLTSGLSIVWDGNEYKQKKHTSSGNTPTITAAWPPKSCYRHDFMLSDFVIPPEALTSGRHTVTVRVEFPESATYVLSSGTSFPPITIAQTNSNRQIFAESSTLTIFIKESK